MKRVKHYPWLRTILISMCVVMSCFAFAIGVIAPAFTGRVAAADDGATETYELTSVELNVRDGYAYTNEISSDPDKMFDLTEVTVTYTQALDDDSTAEPKTESYKLNLSGTGDTRTADTGETVAFAYADNTITATVMPKSGYGTAMVDGSLAVSFGQREVKGIVAYFTAPDGVDLNTLTSINDIQSGITVYYTYNDSTVGNTTQDLVNNSEYTLSGSLFPVKENPTAGGTYTAQLTVTLRADANIKTNVAIDGVKFVQPYGILSSIGGTVATSQVARSELDLGALEVVLLFNVDDEETRINVPLSSFDRDWYEVTYRNRGTGEQSKTLSTSMNQVRFQFVYKGELSQDVPEDTGAYGTSANTSWQSIIVSKLSLVRPTFPTNTASTIIEYTTDVSVDVVFPDYAELFPEGTPEPKLAVDNANATVTPDGNNYNIKFNAPGVYDITVTLDEDNSNNADFEWDTRGGGTVSGNVITYTVHVNKGEFEIKLTGDFTWNYGTTIDDNYIQNTIGAQVLGTLKGSSDTTPTEFYLGNAPADKDSEPDKFGYELEFYDASGNKLPGVPTNAGKYKVKAVTYENQYYKSVVTDDFTDVTVNPKAISATSIINAVTYDGTYHAATDFLNVTGFETADLIGGNAPITVTNADGTSFTTAKYYKNGGYTVTLKITSDNYVWNSLPSDYWDTGVDRDGYRKLSGQTFTVNKREIKYNVSQNDFYYGAAVDISASLVNSADGVYLKSPKIEYTGGSLTSTANDRTNINTWDAGDYKVKYTPVWRGGTDIDEENSLTLTPVTDSFTIEKAQIKNINISDEHKPFDGSAQTFYFTDWLSLVHGGWGAYSPDGSGVVSRSVTATRTDITVPTIAFSDTSVDLTYADNYSVKIEILDKTNFEWEDGAQKNIEIVWTVDKATVTKAEAPASVTYNHAPQSITLVSFDGTKMTVTAISGNADDGSAITTGFTLPADGDDTFSLTLAGEYTVTVALKDDKNYKWDGESGANESAALTLTYTVNRATAALLKDSDELDFSDSVTKYFVLPTAKSAADGNGLGSSDLSFVFTVSGEGVTGVNNTNATSTAITASGTYTYKITGLFGGESNNYVLPDGGLTFTLVVKSQSLAIPVIATGDKTLEYNGAAQSVLSFITNYAAQNYGDRIVIVISKGGVEESRGSDPKVKDVYYDNGVKAYTVTISPASNYKWNIDGTSYAENEEFSFQFTVTQFALMLTWTDGTLSSTYGEAVNPLYTLNKFYSDDVSITVGYKKDKNVLTSISDAGNYFVYAKEVDGSVLQGAAANNYSLTAVDTAYVINKKVVTKPVQPESPFTAAYGDGQITGVVSGLDNGLITASIVKGYRPAIWFDDGNDVEFTLDANYALDIATGVFTFVNAGYYDASFTLDGKNHCWDSDKIADFNTVTYTVEWKHFAEVNRKAVQAPSFNTAGDDNNYRAQEWGESFDGSKITVVSPVDGMNVIVTYGGKNGESNTMPWTSKPTQSDIGQYYILIKLAGDVDILNYVWSDSTDELPSFVEGTDEKKYSVTEVSVLLRYAITGAQLPLTFGKIEYVFGENGSLDGVTPLDLFTALKNSLTDSAKALLAAADNNNGIDFNETNIKLNGIVYEGGADTENDLPWNVGDYTVELTIKFVNHSVYQDLPVKANVSVSPRPIEVEWDNLNKTYDGEDDQDKVFANVAKLINVPKRGGEEISTPALTVRSAVDAINVGTYSITVTALGGDNADNFTVTDAKNYDKDGALIGDVKFEISPRTVKIVGVSPADHVYGETLLGIKYWDYPVDAAEDAKFVDSTENLVVKLVKDGNKITVDGNALPDVGAYGIELGWKDDTAEYALNYTVNFNNGTATFNIVKRQITVTLVGVNKKYFDEIDYTSAYSVTTTNGTGKAVVGDLPFKLEAKDGSGAITKYAAVNTDGYTIYITQINNNYAIEVTGVSFDGSETATNAKYIIGYADIEDITVTGYNGVYDGRAHDLFTSLSATVRNDQKLVWYYSTDGVNWTLYKDGAAAATKQIVNVEDSASYYVKVEAANHAPEIYKVGSADKTAVAVAVAQATMTVTVRGYTVEYNAQSFGYLKDNTASGVALDTAFNSNVKWYIATPASGLKPDADDAAWTEYNAATHCGTNAGTYTFFVKVDAKNYEAFISDELTLTITQAEITVQLDLEIFYYEENPAAVTVDGHKYMMSIADLLAATDNKFTFGSFKGSDGTAFFGGTLLTAGSSFSYTTDYSKGKDIGYYTIKLDASELTSTNYKFTGVDGTLTVKALPITVTVANYTATYNQARETLTPLTATVACTQDSTYGGGIIDISDIAVKDIVTAISTDALKDGAITTNNVKYNGTDYDGYDIKITVSNNYAYAYQTAKYTITRAENKITTENYHLFVTEGFAAKDSSPEAWTYGDKSEYNANGYEKDVHALQTLALVSRDKDLYIIIKRDGEEIIERVAVSSLADATILLKNAFGNIYASDQSFAAGEYTVTFEMAQSNNFDALNESWLFTVAKQEVTVTPKNITIVYGDDLPDPSSGALHTNKYVYEHTPLSAYNNKAVKLTDVVSFVFGSDYAVGEKVDKYTIKVTNASDSWTTSDGKLVYTADNYTVTFEESELTVTQREISIEINPAYNHYMLIGAYNNDPVNPAYADEDAWLLDSKYEGKKYEIISGAFYNTDVPFEIKTQALVYTGSKVTGTLDYGRYAIYAEFVNETFKRNYAVTVVNSAYGENINVPQKDDLGELVITSEEGELLGGIFDVERAQLYMTVTGPYYDDNGTLKLYADNLSLAGDAGIYDGRAKHYKAEAALGNKSELAGKVPQFVPEYYQGQTPLDGAPVDKGSYFVRFAVDPASETDNFEQVRSQSQSFDIAARSLTVSSDLYSADYKYTYKGEAYNVQFSFDNVVATDDLKIVVTINNDKKNYTVSNDGTAIRRRSEAFENVDTYVVEIELSSDMTNYILQDRVITADKEYTASGVYNCTLDIEKKDLYVWIKNAEVQYGTTVFNANGTLATKDARFTGFDVAYGENNSEVSKTEDSLQAIITANKAAGYFVDSSGGIVYAATGYTVTSAYDSTFAITMPYLSASNFNLIIRDGTLTVTKRKINVTVSGADEGNSLAMRVYNGLDNASGNHSSYITNNLNANRGAFLVAESGAFGSSGDDITKLNIELSVSTAAGAVQNVGYYDMTVTYNNTNYAITFKYGTQGKARYEITPAPLKVKVQKANTPFESTDSALTVTYGSDVSDYGVAYSGFVNGETSSLLLGYTPQYSFVYGGKAYKAYESRVGEVYNVSVRFGSGQYQPLTNYTIEYIDTTKLNITPLKIDIAVQSSNVYREAGDGYHDGYYGAAMEAGVTLSGYDAAKSGTEFAPAYTREYSTNAASYNGVAYQVKGAAPRRVGKYTVTVSLVAHKVGGVDYYDYCFDGGVYSKTTDYEITQKVIDLAWENPTIHSDETDKSNSIADYRKSIMSIVTFTRDTVPLDISDCIVSDDEPGLTYNAAISAGRYTVTVVLIESARNNYCWGTAINVEGTQTSAFFTVAGQGVVTLGGQSILGWVYGEYSSVNAPTATLYPHGSTEPITDATILYYFALVTGNVDGVTKEGHALTSFNRNDYATVGAFTLGVPSNAGVYVMRVDFDGNATYQKATSVYYIFRIEKKGIDKPTIEQSVYDETDGAVNITQTVDGFDSSVMIIIGYDGLQTSYQGSALTVGTVNANESGYNIRIGLADSNYYWTDDEDATVIDVKWIVKRATDNNIDWDADHPGREYVYGDAYTIVANAKYNVNGEITYSYADRTKYADAATVPTWINGLPVNVGKYWIRAVSSTATDNYAAAEITTAFEITKAVLHVKPSGSAQYGTVRGNADVSSYSRYEFVDTDSFGFKYSDTVDAVRGVLASNGITYTVANTSDGAWAVGPYGLTVSATHINYEIQCVTGVFEVTKRTLAVTVGSNGSSYYGHAVDYSKVTISLGALVDEADRADIIAQIRAALDAGIDQTSDADTYILGVKSSLVLDNYVVSVTPGRYTVNRLPVRVDVDWGGYAFGSTPVLPKVTAVYDNTNGALLNLTADELGAFSFAYGTADVPTSAGSHPVSVQLASTANYVLVRPVSGLFEISLTELDAELIVWKTVYFDTVCAKPEIDRIEGNAFNESMFTVEYIGDWNKAGVAYIIRLTLTSPESTKWLSVEGATRDIAYTISQGKNELVGSISISGWVFGEYSEERNLPTAAAKFGTVVFEYSDARDGVYTTAAPVGGNVGTYWVRAVVEGTTDYERFVSSDPVSFEITKKSISAPTLNIITEGYGQNNVYTGTAMQAEVEGYDSTLMYIRYDDGTMIVNGNSIKVIATNAGSYRVTITLVHSDNYGWTDGTTLDEDGNATLIWTIERKKLAKPTDNNATLIVNGQELAYYPVGFDGTTMDIEGNTSGYGGTFTATVSIKDTDNYEWEDGTTDSITFEWNVVGANTVFAVVIGILSALAGAAAIGAGVQLFFYMKKKKEEGAK